MRGSPRAPGDGPDGQTSHPESGSHQRSVRPLHKPAVRPRKSSKPRFHHVTQRSPTHPYSPGHHPSSRAKFSMGSKALSPTSPRPAPRSKMRLDYDINSSNSCNHNTSNTSNSAGVYDDSPCNVAVGEYSNPRTHTSSQSYNEQPADGYSDPKKYKQKHLKHSGYSDTHLQQENIKSGGYSDSHANRGAQRPGYDPNAAGHDLKVHKRSWTHPKSQSEKHNSHKSSLYSTTNIGLMEATSGEANYFMSSLSDKLSDYEDIWVNSETPDLRLSDPRTAMEVKSKCAGISVTDRMDISNRHESVSSSFKSVDLSKTREDNTGESFNTASGSMTSAVEECLTFSTPVGVEASVNSLVDNHQKSVASGNSNRVLKQSVVVSTGSGVNSDSKLIDSAKERNMSPGLTALEQARQIAMSASEDEAMSPLPVAHVKGIQRMENVFNDDVEIAVASASNEAPPGRFISEKYIGSIKIPNGANQEIKFITSHTVDVSRPSTQASTLSVPMSLASRASTSTSQLSKCVFTTTMSLVMSDRLGDAASGNTAQLHSSQTNFSENLSDQSVHSLPSQPSSTQTVVKDPHQNANSENVIRKKDVKKPKPLSRLSSLSRVKSSSESSIATLSSPLYAEPQDAVRLRDKQGQAINVKVRRRSAPIAPTKQKLAHKARLETIVSPGG